MTVEVGEQAPDFSLQHQDGQEVTLSSFRHQRSVVLIPMLSDVWPHGEVAKQYGVFDEARGLATRGTFVIDPEGVVRWKVVNGIPDTRDQSEDLAALAAL